MGKDSSPFLRLHPEIVEVEHFYEKYFLERRHGVGIMHGTVWGDSQDGYFVRHDNLWKSIGFYYKREFTEISEEEYLAEKEKEPVPEKFRYQYRAKVERVASASTLDILIDLGFDMFIRKRVRIAGLRGKNLALQAKQRVVQYTEGEWVEIVSLDHRRSLVNVMVKGQDLCEMIGAT